MYGTFDFTPLRGRFHVVVGVQVADIARPIEWTRSRYRASTTTSVVFALTLATSDERPFLIGRFLGANEAQVLSAARTG